MRKQIKIFKSLLSFAVKTILVSRILVAKNFMKNLLKNMLIKPAQDSEILNYRLENLAQAVRTREVPVLVLAMESTNHLSHRTVWVRATVHRMNNPNINNLNWRHSTHSMNLTVDSLVVIKEPHHRQCGSHKPVKKCAQINPKQY